jgi:enoyl-CoA hydratase
MSPGMGRDIQAAVAMLNERDELRSVVIHGRGKSFSAGGDFDLLEARTNDEPDRNRRAMRAFYLSFLSIRELRVPTIAAIHGHAIGAGLCFALGCDIRLAAAGTKLGLTFPRVGLHPGMGATFFMPRAVGQAHAAELMLTGRVFDAEHAERIGLVARVVPPDDLLAAARETAGEIAKNAPIAIEQLTATLRHGGHRTLDETLDREALCQAVDYTTGDMKEAIDAFRNKRAPDFEGR